MAWLGLAAALGRVAATAASEIPDSLIRLAVSPPEGSRRATKKNRAKDAPHPRSTVLLLLLLLLLISLLLFYLTLILPCRMIAPLPCLVQMDTCFK